MNVNIHGLNLTITPGIEEYAQDQVGKLDRYLPNIAEIRLELARRNTKRGEDLTTAQITLRHSRGAILRSEVVVEGNGRDATLAAINEAADKMYRQIERFKGKQKKSQRGDRDEHFKYHATREELETAEEIPVVIINNLPEYDDDAEIVRRKVILMVGMTEQDAIDQMELLGHRFFVFLNNETNVVNVLYRRDSGGYGVLVPQVG
ncbi:MAG: ribosome-associated translation inhibitor RaiA [Anaerolineae bacterium]|jgi:putative sigma-54 modulation protein|nr:ribosome-associated translation inhibitor RaiA [Anaerolineae bacterium]